jgi:hypothetical protein
MFAETSELGQTNGLKMFEDYTQLEQIVFKPHLHILWPHSKICNCMHCMRAQLLPPNMLWPHLPSSFPLPADKIQPKHGQTPPIISKGTFPNSVIDIPRPCPSIVD